MQNVTLKAKSDNGSLISLHSRARFIKQAFAAAAISAAMFMGGSAQASTTTWTLGSGAADWSVAGNWSPSGPAAGAGNFAVYNTATTAATTAVNVSSGTTITIGEIADTNTGNWSLTLGTATGGFIMDSTGISTNNIFGNQTEAAIGTSNSGVLTIGTAGSPIPILMNTALGIGSTSSGAVTVNGNISNNTSSALALNLRANGSGAVTLASGTIGGTGAGSGAINIANVGTSSGGVTISSALGANVGSVLQNSNTSGLTLSGSNTSFVGSVTLQQGTLTLNSTGALGGATSVVWNGGATLNASVGSIATAGNPTWSLNGYDTFSSNSFSTGSGAVTLNGTNVGVITNTTNNLTLTGNVSGSSSLTKASGSTGVVNQGALVLGGTDTYTGGTVVQQGQVQFASAASVPSSGSIQLAPQAPNSPAFEGAAAVFNFVPTQTQLGKITSNSVGVVALGNGGSNGSALDFSSATGANLANVSLGTQGTGTFSGTLTPWTSSNNGSYQLGGSGNQSSSNNNVLTVSTSFGNSGSVATGVIVDPTFAGFGAGSVTLSGTNTYTGATVVNTGTLTVTGSLNSGTALSVNNGGTFTYNPTAGTSTQTVNGLTLGSGIDFINSTATDTLALGAITRKSNAVVDFGTAGTITTSNAADASGQTLGAAYLYNTGSSSTYAAVNGGTVSGLTYAASPTSTQGTLLTNVGNNLVSATTNYSINTPPTTGMTGNSTANTIRYTGSTGGTIEIGGATIGTGAAANTNTLTTNGIMNAGTNILTIQDSGTGATGGLVIGSTNELDLNAANNSIVISANISGTGGVLNISGSNSVTLTGTNTYTGGTVLNQGTLNLGNTTAGTANLGTGTLTLSGGTLQNSGAVSISNNIVFTQGTSTLVNSNSANFTLSGALTGSGAMLAGDGGTFASIVLTGDASGYNGTIIYNGGSGNGDNFSIGGTTAASQDYSQVSIQMENTGSRRLGDGTANTVLQIGSLAGAGQLNANGTNFQVGALNTNSTFGGTFANTGDSLTKVGTGTLTIISQTSQGSSNLFVNNGTLLLDLSNVPGAANALVNGSGLALNGGTLSILGKDTTLQNSSQSINGATISAGSSTISVSNNGGSGTVATLGGLTRNAGGSVNFVLPSGTQSSTNGITATSLQAGDVVNATSNSVSYATVNGTDWATWAGASGTQNIVARSVYTTNAFTGSDTDMTTNTTAGASSNELTLRFNVDGVTLTLGGANQAIYGGVLTTANSNTTGSTITGGTLQTGGGNEFVFADYGKLTVASQLINNTATALTKSGSGTLILSNTNNTYTGVNYLNGGVVNIAAAASLGTNATAGALTFNGGTLQLASAFNLGTTQGITLGFNGGTFDTNSFNSTYAGAITSGGTILASSITANTEDQFGFTKTGAGTLTLTGTNTYFGATSITGGTLSVSYLQSEGTTGGTAPASAGGIGESANYARNLVLNGGTLQYTGAAASTDRLFSLGVNGGSLDASGSGAINFTNTGAVAFPVGSNGVSTDSSPTLTLAGSNTGANTLAATLGNNGLGTTSLVKNGAGNWVLSGANTYTGTTTINAGTLQAGVASVSGISGAFGLNSAVTLANATGATLDLNGFNTQIGSITGGGATGGNVLLGSKTLTVGSDNTSPAAYAGVIGGTNGVLNKIGTGTLALTGANTFTGGTTINAGTVQLGSASALGTGTVQNSVGSTLDLNGQTFGNALINTASGIFNGTITNSNVATATVSSGYNLAGAASFNISDFTINGTGNINWSGAIDRTSFNGTITKAGANTLTLTGVGTGYVGEAYTVSTGVLAFNMTNGSTFSSGNIANSASVVGAETTGVTNTISSAITGTGSFTQSGAGTTILSGVNTYTGNTLLNGGELQVASAETAGTSGPLGKQAATAAGTIVFGGGTLEFSATNTNDYSGRFSTAASQPISIDTNGQTVTFGTVLTSSGGTLALNDNLGTGTLVLNATETYSGATTITSGKLQIGNGGTTGKLSASSTITDNGTLVFNRSNAVVQGTDFSSSAINGGGALTQAGTNTLTLLAANGYTGATTINSGTLQLGNGTTDGDIASSSGIANSGALIFNRSTGSTFTYSNGISGTGTLSKIGAGTQTLGGTNSYSGTTSVSAGTLNLTGSLTGATAVTVSGGKLAESGTGVIGNAATSLTVNGTGTATLAGANTYTGGTTLTAGLLQLNNATALSTGAVALNGGTIDNISGTAFTSTGSGSIGGSFAFGSSGETLANNIALSGATAFSSSLAQTITLNGTGTTLTLGSTWQNNSEANNTLTVNGAGNQLSLGGILLDNTGTTARAQTITGSGNVAVTGVVGNGASTQIQGLTYSGTGTLSLAGNNTYTGATTVGSGSATAGTGTVILSGNNTAATGATGVGNGSTLQLQTNANALAGSALTLFNGSTLQLHGNTATAFNEASLALASGAAVTFDVNNASSGTAQTMSLSQPITLANNSSNTINITGGNSDVLALGNLVTVSTSGGPYTLTINPTTAAATAGTITDGAFGANTTFTGSNNVSVGNFNFNSNGNDGFTVNGATVTITGANTNTLSARTNGTLTNTLASGTLNLNNSGILTNTGSTAGNSFVITGGTLNNTSGAAIVETGNPAVSLNGSFIFTGSNNLGLGSGGLAVGAASTATISANTLSSTGALSDTGFAFTKAGTGTLSVAGISLTGANTISSTAGALNSTAALTVASGSDIVNATAGTLSFTTVTRSSGGSVDFGIASSNISDSQTATSFLGGWATVNGGTGFAAVSGGKIVAATVTGALPQTGGSTAANYTLAGSQIGVGQTGNTVANSLVITDTGSSQLLNLNATNLTFTNGGGLSYAGGTSNAYTISGTGTIGAGAGNEFVVNTASGAALTISAPTVGAGSGSLTKDGTGTLLLSGASAYTGGTIVNGGTLKAGVATIAGTSGAFGTGVGTMTVNSGATTDINGFGVTVGALSGTGTILNNGGSAATLTINYTNTGGNNGETVILADGSSPLSVIKTGAGTVQVNNAGNTYSGGTTISGGTFRGNSTGSAIGTGTLTLNGGGFYIPSQGGVDTNYANNIVVNNVAGNKLQIDQGSTFSGTVTGSGSLAFTNGFTPTYNMSGNESAFTGTFDLSNLTAGAGVNFTNATNANAGSASAAYSFGASASTAFLQFATGTSGTVSLGSLAGSGTTTIVRNGSASTTQTLQVGALNTSTTYAGTIVDGAGITALTKTGTGSLTLTGANTFSGATTVNGGNLVVGGANGTVATSGSLTINNTGTLTQGDGTNNGNIGTLAVTDNTGGTFAVNGGTTAESVSNIVTGGGAVTLASAAGSNVNTFGTTSNTYSGGTTVTAGTWTAGGANAFGTGDLTIAPTAITVVNTPTSGVTTLANTANVTVNNGTATGTLNINSSNQTINTLSGNGSVVLNNAFGTILTVGNNSTNSTFSGVVSDNNAGGSNFGGAIYKTGTDTLTLSGANTYTNANGTASYGTEVAQGVLNIQNNSALGAGGTVAVDSGATLQMQGGITVTGNALTISGTGATSATGALENISGSNSYAGGVTLAGATKFTSDAGNLDISNAGGAIGGSGNLTLAGAGNGSIEAAINTGGSALTKSGAGTWTLAGASAYSGATTISGGTLNVTGSINNSAVSIASTATLAGTGSTGAVTLASGGAMNLSGDNVIGTLTVAGLTTTGGGSMSFDISGGGSTTVDKIADTGSLSIGGVTTINIANLGGITQSLTNGTNTYALLTYGSGSALLSDFNLSTTSLDSKILSLSLSGNTLYLNVAPPASSTSYTVVTTAGSTLLHAGATTGLTTTITNTGTGSADSLNYTGLTASSSLSNGITTGTQSGGPVAHGGGTASNGQTYTATTAGTDTISANASGTNATIGGAATQTSATGTAITVYSGFGTWTGATSTGSWGTAPTASPVNWTAAGGTPGVTAGFTGVDTATFGAVSGGTTPTTVTLDGANPNLNAINFTTASRSYTIAQGTGGAITLSGTTPSVNVTAGSHKISAPITIAADTALSESSGTQLEVSGQISGGHGLNINGAGTTILSSTIGNNYSGTTTISGGGTTFVNSGVTGTSSGTGSGAINVTNGMLAGSGSITSPGGISVSGSGKLSSGAAQSITSGVVDGTHLTINNTSVLLASANLTFDLGAGNDAGASYHSFANPNTNTTYLKLAGSTTINFTGTESLSLVDLTNTTGSNGALALRYGTPYLLIQANTNASYLNLVINSGTNANPIYSLSQSGGLNGYVVGVYNGNDGLNPTSAMLVADSGADISTILITQFQSNGVTELTPGANGTYAAPVLFLDNGMLEVVPEPGTWALMIGGLALLVVIQRRRRNQG